MRIFILIVLSATSVVGAAEQRPQTIDADEIPGVFEVTKFLRLSQEAQAAYVAGVVDGVVSGVGFAMIYASANHDTESFEWIVHFRNCVIKRSPLDMRDTVVAYLNSDKAGLNIPLAKTVVLALNDNC